MKKAFSKVLHARSKVKEFFNFFSNSGNLVNLLKSTLNIIHTTLQAETLILACPPFCLIFCQSFCPGGHLLRLIHMRVHIYTNTTSDQWTYFDKKQYLLLLF